MADVIEIKPKKAKRPTDENMPLDRLQDAFIKLCWKWIGENQATRRALAKKTGLDHPRISELMNKTRPLTMYYLRRFIKRGVFMVDDIFDGAPESEEEREQWEILRVQEDMEIQRALSRAFKNGFKRDMLMAILKSHSNQDPGPE